MLIVLSGQERKTPRADAISMMSYDYV